MRKIFLYNFKCVLQAYCLRKIGCNRKKDHTTDGVHSPVHYRILNNSTLDFLIVLLSFTRSMHNQHICIYLFFFNYPSHFFFVALCVFNNSPNIPGAFCGGVVWCCAGQQQRSKLIQHFFNLRCITLNAQRHSTETHWAHNARRCKCSASVWTHDGVGNYKERPTKREWVIFWTQTALDFSCVTHIIKSMTPLWKKKNLNSSQQATDD